MQVSDLGLDMCNAHEDVRKGTKRRFVTCKFQTVAWTTRTRTCGKELRGDLSRAAIKVKLKF